MKHCISKIAIVACCLIFATSCVSTKYLSIDVLQPAKIKFAETVVNIGIVDNAGAAISDTVQDVTHSPSEVITSRGKDVFLSSLAQFMDEEKYFNAVTLYPKAIRTDKNYGRQLPMMKSTIRDIAKEIDADAIISLDVFDTESSERMITANGWRFSAAEAKTSIMFRIYNSAGAAISPIMATTDSLTWMGDPDTQYSDLEYYEQLSLRLSEGMTKQLIPYWETQERMLYTDGTKLMKTAKKHFDKGQWADAAKVWGAAFENESNSMRKAKIASNIALANESLGDITNAVQWIRIAGNMLEGDTKKDESININWYKIKLLERQQNNPKVLEQMGVKEEEE